MAKTHAGVDPNTPSDETSQINRRFPLDDETHHILENVLKLKQDSEVHEAFYHSGIEHPNDLADVNLTTGPKAILTYGEEVSHNLKYASRHQMKVHKLIAYVHWNQEHGDSSKDYGKMTLDDLDNFLIDGRLKMMAENDRTKYRIRTKPPPAGHSTQSAPIADERVKERVKVVLLETVLPARELNMGSDSASVTVTHSQGDGNVQPSVIGKTQGDAPDTKCTELDIIHDSLPVCHNRSPNVHREHDISFRHHLSAYSHDLAYFPSHVPPDITCQNINATEHELIFDRTTSSKDVPTLQAQTVEVSMTRHVDIVLVHQTRCDETLDIDHEIHNLVVDNPTSQRPIDVHLHRTADTFDSVPTRQTSTVPKPAQSWVKAARIPRLDQRRFPMSRLDRKHFPMSRLQKRVPRLDNDLSSETPSRPPDTLAPLPVVSVAEIIAPFHFVDVGRDDPGSLDIHQKEIDTSVDHGSGQASDSLLVRSTVNNIEEAADIRIVVHTVLKKTVVINGTADIQSLVPYNADTVQSRSHSMDTSLQDNTPHLRGVMLNGLISDHAQVKPSAVILSLNEQFYDSGPKEGAQQPTREVNFVGSDSKPPTNAVSDDDPPIVGRTFLQNVNNEDGTRHRCKIVETIQDRNAKLKKDSTLLKFLCAVNDDEYQEIPSHNEILDRTNSHTQKEEQIWHFKRIFAHQGPLRSTDKDWKRSAYNVGLEWKNGERTYESLAMIKVDDPTGTPEPLGKWVTVTKYVGANLMHDMITGRSVTGILLLLNKTPVDRYSKKQATVETATNGSEFVAAHTATHMTFDLVYALRYLDVKVRPRIHMFGDNESVVNSASIPQSKLHKRYMELSYYRVREAIASGFIQFHFIPGESNPADIVSKHWGYAKIWQLLRPLLFWARTEKAKSDDKPP